MRYSGVAEEKYLQDTLYEILNVKTAENSVYKSIKVKEVRQGIAYLECEPYDEAYTTEKAERTIKRRSKAIMKALGVKIISAEVWDEWTYVFGILVKKEESV